MRPIVAVALVCGLAAAVPASAQVYRWVDDRGVVNYAEKPPGAGRHVTRVDLQESRISIIPTAPRTAVGGAPAAAALPPAPSTFPGTVDEATMGALQRAPDRRHRGS